MAKKKKTYEELLREIREERNLDIDKEVSSFQEYVESSRPIEAPIRTDLDTQEEERTWFKSGHFSDGYDFGDVTRTILGSGADLIGNATESILGLGEKAVDALAYVAPAFTMGQQVQNGGAFDIKQYRELQGWSKEFIEKDLYNEEKIAKKVIVDPAKKIGIDAEKGSVFGEKSDSVIQSAGQLAGTAALQLAGVPWWLTTGVTSFGSEAENALEQGASYDAAGGSALISAGAEILTEKLSGGIKFGGKTLDDVYIKPLTEKITDKTVKALANVGIDAVGEGGEEVLSQVISNLGTSLYKEESIGELIASEEALDGYIESFIGGAVLGGGVSGIRTIRESNAAKKAESFLTDNEQTLVNAEVTNRTAEVQKQKTVANRIKSVIEEQERTFGSLTETEKKNIQQRVQSQLDSGELDYTKTELDKKELANIEKEVREDLERGYIGIDTIENTFAAEKTAKIKELEQSLINITDDAKKAEIEAEIGQLKVDRATELTGKFTNDNYLQESYRQEALKKQEFEYEVSENDSDITKELVESAKNTKMNNTRKMHELFEYTNKIANDTGTKYGFVNNEQLKQLGHDIEGKTVNGLVRVNKDGSSKILINVDSDKALNTIIGHETTHLLEGTSEYKALQEIVKEYAITKGDYDGRLKQFQGLYKGIDANIDNEVTADLVGDYLFTDEQFINNLSTKQPNVFQKVYDFIKHAYKMVTAGSKEARQLEQVKRRFEKAYKELNKTVTDKTDSNLTIDNDSNKYKGKSETKYSIKGEKANLSEEEKANLQTAKKMKEDGKSNEEIYEETGWYTQSDGKWRTEIIDEIAKPYNFNKTGLQSAKDARADQYRVRADEDLKDEMVSEEIYNELIAFAEGIRSKDIDFGKLPEFLNAPKLYEAYPQLKDTRLSFRKIPNAGGYADPGMNQIVLDPERLHDAGQTVREGLAHEIQHIIQNIEGFARGTTPKDAGSYEAYRKAGGEIEARDVEDRLRMTAEERRNFMPVQFSISDSNGRKLTKEQQTYFKDSKVRDDNGSLMVMYHGTPNGDFTTFRSGSYFTPNKEYADVYQSQGASSLGYKKTANNPDTYEVYLDIKKPFDTRNPKERKIFEEEYYGQWGMGTPLMDSGLPDWLDGEDLQEFLEENGYDYDGLILDEGGVGGYGDDVKSRGFSYVVFNPEQVKRVDNTKPTKDPDIRFSLSAPVEETKKMVAWHNMSVEGLQSAVSIGGLAMPSFAVKPEGNPHLSYGEVSVIAKRDDVEPSKNVRIFGGDAWTPDVGDLNIHYKINDKAINRINRNVRELIGDVDLGNLGLDETNAEDQLNRQRGNVYNAYGSNVGLRYAYLKDKGIDVSLPTRETPLSYKIDNEGIKYIVEHVSSVTGADEFERAYREGSRYFKEHRDVEVEAIREVVNNYYAEKLGSRFEEKEFYTKDRFGFSEWDSIIRGVQKYRTEGVKTAIDIYAAKDVINEKVDEAGFKKWLSEQFDGVIEKTGIRNEKELFTPSGNRRSFETLHWEYNLANIVKALKGKDQQGKTNFLSGIGSAKGAALKDFKSIEDVRKSLDRIVPESKIEETKEAYDIFNERIKEVASIVNPNDMLDGASDIAEILAKNKTKSGILRYLTKEFDPYYHYDNIDLLASDIYDLIDLANKLPMEYFEAKLYREYSFDEPVGIVVPDNIDEELFNELKKLNDNVLKYEAGNDADRVEKVNSLSDAKFSLSAPGDIAPVNRRGIYGRDVKLQEDAMAPIKETTTDPTDIAPVREKLQLSRPLTEEDLPLVDQERAAAFNNLPDYVPEDIEYYNEADTAPLDDAYLRLVAKNMRSELGLKGNQLAGLRRIIQDFSTSDEQNIATLYDAIESEFGTIQEPRKLAEVAEIKDALRTMRIKVSDVIKGDIPDYAKWKQKQFGKIRITNDGLDVDDVYEGLKDVYPGFFPDDIVNPTDQLLKIAEVAGMDHKYMEEYLIPEENLQEVTEFIYESVTDYKQQKRLDAAREAAKAPIDESMVPYRETVLETPIPENMAPVKPKEAAEVPTEEKEERTLRQEIHKGYMDKIRDAFSNKGYNFDEVLNNAKSLSTFASVDNTPQRFIEKTLGYKEGQILNDLTTNKVALNESEGIKWLNSFTDRKNGTLAQIAKEYNIKPNSKEDAAAQMYGEGFYLNDAGDLIKYGDMELALDFPDATVRNNIKKLATDPRIRQIYDETLDSINESRKRNGYPEIPRRDNYFLHFRAMEDTFSQLGLPFNPNDIRAKDLPTDINGMTADLKPGQPYFASAKQRKGMRTSFSLMGGLERYLGSAKNQIYHIDDIQINRALRNYVADMYGQANGLEGLDALTEEEAEARIKQVYGAHLSNFAKFLNEQANVLAGKTSLADRGLEGIIGRRGITTLDTINSQVGKNMIGFNVSSSLTNLVSSAQAFAKTNKYDSMKALSQTIFNRINSIYGKSDGFVENDPTMIRRMGAQKLSRTPFEKISDIGYSLMSGVDSISSEFIIRAKYNELTRKGMSDKQAHIEAGKWASRILGDRSLGQQPHLYNSKMLGLFTKFQLEVRNQLDSQFYDTIQEANVSTEQIQNQRQRNAVKAAKITSTFVQLAVFQHLFGKAFEAIAGYNPAFDIIGVMIKTLGFDDDEESEDTALDNLEQGFLELLGDLPYTSTLTGGRIPIESALPIEQLVTGKDDYGNDKSRWDTIKETAPYYVLPGGYGQIKKTTQGLGMFDSDLPVSGSYTDSGNLRFPVEDTPLNRLQAGLFGQWASQNAGDYFDNERQPLKEKQIQEYKDLDIPIADYWKYREDLKEQKTTEDKFNFIAGLDLPVDKKNIMINNAVNRKESVDLINYDDFGSYEEFDFATRYPEKYEFFESNGISYRDYKASEESKEAYNWAFNNPEKYSVAKAAAADVVTYRSYTADLNELKADKDGNGKTISGSRKTKVANYINSLDADYGSKLILFKSEYPSDDRYNNEIIEYLNNRQDISYDEEVTILTELGFVVDANGNVRW